MASRPKPPPPASPAPAAKPPATPLVWAPWEAATFERAKREGRLLLFHGAAAWCHWCHVMEATTYADPRVKAELEAHFIPIRVDIDSRPDLAERYEEWGWPATVLLDPEANELGKFRGYLEPEALLAALKEAREAGRGEVGKELPLNPRGAPWSREHWSWIRRSVEVSLRGMEDAERGGWGTRQKTPLGWNNAWLLRSARRGDVHARDFIALTLDQQSRIQDPVWGGLCQYSVRGDWEHPHFEKLLAVQALALWNQAEAWTLLSRPSDLQRAGLLRRFLEGFLRDGHDTFRAAQDADVGAHDASQSFMAGADHALLDDAGRRKAGLPWVDPNAWARDNGLVLSAYVALFEATGDASALAQAQRTAKRLLSAYRTPAGAITHGPEEEGRVLFLADGASVGRALLDLHRVTERPELLEAALTIATGLDRALTDPATGALFDATPDPHAAGAFARRHVPFEPNVMAARLFLALGRALRPEQAAPWHPRALEVLRALLTPEQLDARGRYLGDLLLALDDAGL